MTAAERCDEYVAWLDELELALLAPEHSVDPAKQKFLAEVQAERERIRWWAFAFAHGATSVEL